MTLINVNVDIQRTHPGLGDQLGFDFIADHIVGPDISEASFSDLDIVRNGLYCRNVTGDLRGAGGFFAGRNDSGRGRRWYRHQSVGL